MASDDTIPSNDEDFHKFQTKLVGAVAADPAKLGCTDQDKATVQGTQATWDASWDAWVKAKEALEKATAAKNAARAAHEPNVRGLANKINATPGMDNPTRLEAGLPARDPSGRKIIGAPTTRPLGRTEAKGRGTLVLHFVDETTPMRLAKPQGVHGCELYYFIGDAAPADPSGFTFLAVDTKTPYIHELELGDIGKTVHYVLRWQNAKGQPGPWGDGVSAKIPG